MKRLLLIGGGHSHIEVVRRFAATPLHGAEVVLISPARYMTYTGMLPGHIAGHYGFHDCHIDLEPLCRAARMDFVQAEVTGLDLVRGEATCKDGDKHHFDLLSLDVGSVPSTTSVAAASGQEMPVKPFAALLAGWERILAAGRITSQNITVVGGGAGGVELALAMEHRLRAAGILRTRLALVTDAATLLPGHPPAARGVFERLFAERGIALHCASRVVTAEAGVLHLENGARLGADWIVWATSAAAPAWLAASGLATDARGFVSVDDALRSISHAQVFAAGDCAAMTNHALPKSGVYAVRQGPPLAANLRNALTGAPLARYAPQRRALAMISTGDRHAVASWGGMSLSGRWVWWWKDHIDRGFVMRYNSNNEP